MKKIYTTIFATLFINAVTAQINITSTDMPVSGDTLRYSFTAGGSGIDISNTGTSMTWDYSTLTPVGQRVDTYKTVSQVNLLLTLPPYSLPASGIGYKVADTLPGLGGVLPVSIKSVYTFYSTKNSPSRFVAEGFTAMMNGIPLPATYSDEDELYFFPLAYGNAESNTTFNLNIALPSIGTLSQKGTRKTTVDGWGTIVTPYYTNPVNCIRVRSEIHETDSVVISPFPAIKIPRNTVEYKWLAKGEHYPALWVTANLTGTTETVSSVRYRDIYRPGLLNIKSAKSTQTIQAYPNPAVTGIVTLSIPKNWKEYTLDVYDILGKQILSAKNTNELHLDGLIKGNYLIIVTHADERAFVTVAY